MPSRDQAPSSAPSKGKAIPATMLAIIAATLALEGGYVKNDVDPGGETNFGITKATAERNGYRGPMRTLPREVAESIYYREYLVAPGYEPLVAIDAAVASELFDTTVNMGAPRPSRWFEQSVNELCGARLTIDGRVGATAIAAYSACQRRRGAARLCVAMLDDLDRKQAAEYRRLVRINPKLRPFLKGWLAHRVGNVDRRTCSAGR